MTGLIRTDLVKPRLLANFRREIITPDLEIKRLDDLDYEQLANLGIRAIVLDFDNLLGPHGSYQIDDSLSDYVKELDNHFYLVILSNAGARRKGMIERYSGIGVVKTVPKPHPKAFREAWYNLTDKINLREHPPRQLDRSEIAMIDDRLMTGVSGANRAGWYTIKADPLYPESDPAIIRVARNLEGRLLTYYKQKQGHHLPQSINDVVVNLKR